jgi:GrpB-like predicted nucleotidyltransferase (UPF0157 family)
MASEQREPRATTDEDLARATIGEVRRLDGSVTLVESDPAWPERYAALACVICEALGDAILLVEHVGSTSVPGLVAKPIIDIVLAVADSADEATYVAALEPHGYALRIREPDWYEHRMLTDRDAAVNLHVFSAGCPEINRMLLFRDRLRSDPAERDRYAAVKRRLAAQHWRHVQNYADAKTAAVEHAVARSGVGPELAVPERVARPDARHASRSVTDCG